MYSFIFNGSLMVNVSRRHEFIQLCDLVIGDAAKNVGEPGLRIDVAELCCFDQGRRAA
jgi:hypothetical protein